MKRKITFLVLACVLSVKPFAFSNHITGGEMTYIYLSPNSYEVTLKLYRDCSGIPIPNTADICYSSVACGMSFSFPAMKISSQELLQPACTFPGLSICQGGSAPGVEEVVYMDTVTLTGPCADWVFSYATCCTGATTINGQPSVYIDARLNNVLDPTGSSPQFQSHALPWFCLNVFSMYDFACIDPDGDGLLYSFETVMDDAGACPPAPSAFNYNVPYSPSNPLSSLISITLSAAGMMAFTPNVIQTAIIKVRVTATGGGGITGTVMRQNVVTIANGITGIPALSDKKFSVSLLSNVSQRYFNCSISNATGRNLKIKIFNAFGEEMYAAKPVNVNGYHTLDMAGFAGGVYFVSFISGNELRTEKIIKL